VNRKAIHSSYLDLFNAITQVFLVNRIRLCCFSIMGSSLVLSRIVLHLLVLAFLIGQEEALRSNFMVGERHREVVDNLEEMNNHIGDQDLVEEACRP
jgi:hypothetical protein